MTAQRTPRDIIVHELRWVGDPSGTATDIIAVLRAAGYLIVPRRPTGEMYQAGEDALDDGLDSEGIWTAMRDAAIREDQAQRDAETPPKLWIWKNFVDGRPEFWAFDNPYPVHLSPNGDPMVLGEPVGYAIFKSSRNGRPDRTEEQVIAAIKSLKAHTVAETTRTPAETSSPPQGGGTNPPPPAISSE